MNAREMLENYGELVEKSRVKAREVAICRRQAGRDAENEERLQKRLARLLSEQKSLNRRMLSRQKQLEHLLSKMEEEQQSQVLALRYLGLLSYEQIGRALHFSPRHIFRLHLTGVKALEKILEK